MSKISTQIFLQKLNLTQLVVDNYFSQKLSQLVDYHYVCIQIRGLNIAYNFVHFLSFSFNFNTGFNL